QSSQSQLDAGLLVETLSGLSRENRWKKAFEPDPLLIDDHLSLCDHFLLRLQKCQQHRRLRQVSGFHEIDFCFGLEFFNRMLCEEVSGKSLIRFCRVVDESLIVGAPRASRL